MEQSPKESFRKRVSYWWNCCDGHETVILLCCLGLLASTDTYFISGWIKYDNALEQTVLPYTSHDRIDLEWDYELLANVTNTTLQNLLTFKNVWYSLDNLNPAIDAFQELQGILLFRSENLTFEQQKVIHKSILTQLDIIDTTLSREDVSVFRGMICIIVNVFVGLWALMQRYW